MSKFSTLKLVAYLVILHGITGLKAEDPSFAFSIDVLNIHHDTNFNFWGGGSYQPEGGMVVRSKFDVNGDGIDDWLYKSTLETDENLGWSVYLSKENDHVKLKGSIPLDAGVTYVERGGEQTVFTSIYKKADWLGITKTHVNLSGEITIEQQPPIEGFEHVSKIVNQEGWPHANYGQILKTTNDEVTSLQSILDEAPQWKTYKSYFGIHGQYKALSENDKKQLFPYVLTPNKALSFITNNTGSRTATQTNNTSGYKLLGEDPLHSKEKYTENKNAIFAAPWTYYVAAILLLASLGAWIFLRKSNK